MITLAQQLEARGEARGMAVGEARGEERATRQALEMVLSTRFGTLPSSVEQALVAADLSTLQTWLQRAVQAPTLEDIGIS